LASIRISKRWLLVVLVAAGQLVCLGIGVAWFANWLEGGLNTLVRQQVLSDNQHIAGQMASFVEHMGLTDLTVGDDDWQRLQDVVERFTLPNRGFLCVISATTGKLVCHPDMRRRPELADVAIGLVTLHGPDPQGTILEASSGPGGRARGWAHLPDGKHLIAVQSLPRLDAKVLAHQDEANVLRAIGRVMRPLRAMAILVLVVLIASGMLVTALIVRQYENRLADINANLEQLVEHRSRALTKTRDAVIFGLAKLAESRDDATGAHLDRIRGYSELLAAEVSRSRREIDEPMIRTIGITSSLHDIGKVGIADAVLLKPDVLTDRERDKIRRHVTIGGDTLLAIKRRLGEDDFLVTACEITLSHHERWDGTGYPYGLKGEQIPLAARIVALADFYDAMTTKRPYKEAVSHERAREMIVDGAGRHFDPKLVEAFLACQERFREVAANPPSGFDP